MAYITLQTLIDRFGAEELVQLLNDRNTTEVTATMLEAKAGGDPSNPFPGSLTSAQVKATNRVADVISEAIADGEAVVESYVQNRLTIPIGSDPPLVLVNYAADVIRYQLFQTPTREVQKRYDNAMEWFKMAAAGRVNFGTKAGGEAVDDFERIRTVVSTDEQAAGRVFTRSKLSGFLDP